MIAAYALSALVSWYSLPGNLTSNGEMFAPSKHTCASRTLPFNTKLRLLRVIGRLRLWSWCRVNDRGPFIAGRSLDVSPAVRNDLHFNGLAKVIVYLQKRIDRAHPRR